MSNSNKKILIFILMSFSLYLGLFFGENSSGGAKHDYNFLIKYIIILSDNFIEGFEKYLSNSSSSIHSPVFYILLSIIYNILNNNILLTKLIYCSISLFLPYLFYKILTIKYQRSDLYIFFFSIIIFYSPYFRSSAIWLLGDNLALIFFSLFILKVININNEKKKISYYFLAIIFLVIASYLRYYYSIYYLVIIYLIFKNKLEKIKIIKIFLFSFILSLPALYYFFVIFLNYDFFNTIGNFSSFNYFIVIHNIYLINLFYLVPIALLKFNYIINYYVKNKFELIILFIISFLIFNIQYFFFNNNFFDNNLGGGVIIKFFNLFFNSNYILIIPFTFSFILNDFIFKGNRIFNYFILTTLIFSLPMNIIYQKYLDPLLFFLYFGLCKSDFFDLCLKNSQLNVLFINLYFFSFLIFANFFYLN
jgi:hypothetical protein